MPPQGSQVRHLGAEGGTSRSCSLHWRRKSDAVSASAKAKVTLKTIVMRWKQNEAHSNRNKGAFNRNLIKVEEPCKYTQGYKPHHESDGTK